MDALQNNCDYKLQSNFRNNVPQHEIGMTLNIPSSEVHDIIKRLREPGDVSLLKGHKWKSKLAACDLQALRQHRINNRHDSVMEITARAQEHLQKSWSVNTVHRVIHKCRLKLCHAKESPYVNMFRKRCRLLWAKANLKTDWGKVENCSLVRLIKMDIHFGNHKLCILRTTEEGDHVACFQRSDQKHLSGYEGGLVQWNWQLAHPETLRQCWKF